MPLARGRENADSGVFFTVPWLVAMNTKCSSSNCLMGSTALIFSPSSSGSRLTMGLPREPRPGLRQLEHALPVDLAAIARSTECVSCVCATKSFSTKSSSFTDVAALPRPPRRCAWYSVTGCALGVTGVRQRDHHVLRLDQIFGG